MCITCWNAYGSPSLTGETIDRLRDLIADVYGECLAGGRLHIVLDDWNIEDISINWCLKNAGPLTNAERSCGEALLAATLEERASALARFDGYTKETP